MTTLLIPSRISTTPIRAAELVEQLADDQYGGIVTFEGVVRRHSRGKRVVYLEYDAYPEMAAKQMDAVILEAQERWPETKVAAVHRIGPLAIGDIAVAIVAVSAHRAEAFEACRFTIDTIKQRVPIWKKEIAEDGEEWIEGEGAPTAAPGTPQ